MSVTSPDTWKGGLWEIQQCQFKSELRAFYTRGHLLSLSGLDITMKLCNRCINIILYQKNIDTSPNWHISSYHSDHPIESTAYHWALKYNGTCSSLSDRKTSIGFTSRISKRVVLSLTLGNNKTYQQWLLASNKGFVHINNSYWKWTTWECTGTCPDSKLKCPLCSLLKPTTVSMDATLLA